MALSIFKMNLYLKLFYQFASSYQGTKHAKYWTPQETAEQILNGRKSFIRLGDGEFDILLSRSIHYQEYSAELANKLDFAVNEYIAENGTANYIVGMPAMYIQSKGTFLLKSRLLLSCWASTRYCFGKKYDVAVNYGDAFLFGKGNEKIYERIWSETNINKVVFVHNDETYSNRFVAKYNIPAEFVKIPNRDAFEQIEVILKKIIDKSGNKEDTMVLISAGPCGKVLVYELQKQGIWAIDTGHCWDEPLQSKIY